MNVNFDVDSVLSPSFSRDYSHNSISVDWLSFTMRSSSDYDVDIARVKKLLGLENVDWQNMSYILPGTYYSHHISYLNISIQWGVPDSSCTQFRSKSGGSVDTIHVSMSGSGCRTFEHCSVVSWNRLFFVLCSDPSIFNITRLDVAYDDFEGVINFAYLCSVVDQKKVSSDEIISLFDIGSFEVWRKRRGDASVYFGSRSSDCFMRVYDKLIEQRYKFKKDLDYLSSLPDSWVRWEIVLRHENAFGFVSSYLSTCSFSDDSGELGSIFKGVLLRYIRFVVPSDTDINKSRWKLQDWFVVFLGNASKISIWSKQDQEYSVEVAYRWVMTSCSNSSGLVMLHYSPYHYLNDIREHLLSYDSGLPPPKYLEALNRERQRSGLPVISSSSEFKKFVHDQFDDAIDLLLSGGVIF